MSNTFLNLSLSGTGSVGKPVALTDIASSSNLVITILFPRRLVAVAVLGRK